MNGQFGFGRHLDALESLLVSSLSLTPHPLPPGMERAQGEWRDGLLTLEARAFTGPRVRYARFVSIRGSGLEIANALVFPVPGAGAPIFGADLVDLSARGALAAIDLSPVCEGGARDRQLSAISGFVEHLPKLPRAGELPEWSARWFSPHAFHARLAPEQAPVAGEALLAFARAFLGALQQTPVGGLSAASELALQAEYARAHREGERGLQLLPKVFGTDWATPFVAKVLFPESESP